MIDKEKIRNAAELHGAVLGVRVLKGTSGSGAVNFQASRESDPGKVYTLSFDAPDEETAMSVAFQLIEQIAERRI